MSKKKTIIALAILACVGSLWAFYASNLFFGDVSNVSNGITEFLLVSLTALLLGALFVTATLYVARLYMRPKTIKRLSRNYLFIAMGISFVGFLTALLAGVTEYGNFAKPYPFPGYLIIMMIVHLLVLGGAVFAFIKFVKPLPEDEEKFKVSVKHIFKTLGWFTFISLAYNRFGAFLLMPFFVYLRNLYLTIFFYLFLLVPAAVLFKKASDVLDIKFNKFLYSWILLGVAVALMAANVIIGINNTAFVSSVSPMMPLERLASKPLEILIHFLSAIGIIIYYVVTETIKRKGAKAE